MKNSLKLIANSLSKSFYLNKPIFSDISFELQSTDIFGIAGENGSGKSTLLKILAGVSTPSAGTVNIFIDEQKIDNSNHFEILGFVSPYLSIYEEFTPIEHFSIASKIKGTKQHSSLEIDLLKKFKLFNRKNDPIKTFSSGMKQRIKFILAFLSQPKIVFLDEPFTNLDNEGINTVTELIEQHKINNGLTIIASNDDREKTLCNEIIELKKRNNQ